MQFQKPAGLFFIAVLLSTNFCFAQKLIAHFPFDNTLDDLSSMRNIGRINGGVLFIPDRFGNPCSAVLFDGKTGFIDVSNSPSLESPTNQLSISLWYKLTENNSNNYWLTALCKGETLNEIEGNPQYRLQVQQNTKVELNTCNPYSPTSSSTISISTSFTQCDKDFALHLFEPDVWHFYVLNFDGSEVVVYMDAKKVFSAPYNKPFIKNKSPLYIGKDEPGAIEYFNGAIDDLRIYDYSISENVIQNLFNEKNNKPIKEEFEIKFPENIYVESNNYSCESKVYFPKPVYKSNCSSVSILQIEGLASGSSFPIGFNRIRFEFLSSSGYSQVITYYVVVKDKTPPKLVVPKDTVLYSKEGENGLYFLYNDPIASDNCTIKEIKKIEGIASGGFFPIGNNKITFYAQDMSGNSRESSFNVEVKPFLNIQSSPLQIDTTKLKIDSISKFENKTIEIKDLLTKDSLSTTKYKPNNLVFLLDVSASMNENNKIALLKTSLVTLIKKLRSIDYVTIISYAEDVKIILKRENISDKSLIINLINSLKPFGGTQGEEGIDSAYNAINQTYLPDANNEIYLATDGVFEISKKQKKTIQSSAIGQQKRITLNILAFGNSASSLYELKSISDLGKGQYLSITTEEEAEDLLLRQIKINSKK